MTDPQNPGEKPDIDDVVERANAGLAEAEAARAANARRVQYPAPNPEQNVAKPDAAAPEAASSGAAESAAAAADEPRPEDAAPAETPTPEPAASAPAEYAAAADAASAPEATAPAEPAQAAEPSPTAEPVSAADSPAAESTAADASEPTAAEPTAAAAAGTAATGTAATGTAATADAEPAHTAAEPEADAPTTAIPADTTAARTDTTVTPAETTVIAGGAAAASAPAASAPAAEPAGLTAVAGPRPVYVSAPDAPTPRGNRGAAGLIGLVAAVAFAVLYLGVWTLIQLVDGSFDAANYGNKVLDQLSQFDVWTPTIVFFLGFWLLGAFINRARWGYWVVFGILVGAAAYIGHIAGQLAHAQAWNLSYAASEKIVHAELFAPMAIAAFIIGRELTIWFGAWVAARGRKVTELNVAEQEEYERSLEAGPQAAAETR